MSRRFPPIPPTPTGIDDLLNLYEMTTKAVGKLPSWLESLGSLHPGMQERQLGETLLRIPDIVKPHLEVVSPVLRPLGGLPSVPTPVLGGSGRNPFAPPGPPDLTAEGRAVAKEPVGRPTGIPTPATTVQGTSNIDQMVDEVKKIKAEQAKTSPVPDPTAPDPTAPTPAAPTPTAPTLSERDIRRQQLEEQIAGIDLQRKGLETPTEMPTGVAGWTEAILSALSRGDAGAIHAERERKREKALGLLKEKRGELRGEEARLYGRQQAEAAAEQKKQHTQAMIANLTRRPMVIDPPYQNEDGEWVANARDSFDPTGKVQFVIRSADPGVARGSQADVDQQMKNAQLNHDLAMKRIDATAGPTNEQKELAALVKAQVTAQSNALIQELRGVMGAYPNAEEREAAMNMIIPRLNQLFAGSMLRMQEIFANPGAVASIMQQIQGGGGGQPLQENEQIINNQRWEIQENR
jgi:hypothetical protein